MNDAQYEVRGTAEGGKFYTKELDPRKYGDDLGVVVLTEIVVPFNQTDGIEVSDLVRHV